MGREGVLGKGREGMGGNWMCEGKLREGKGFGGGGEGGGLFW